MNSFIKVKMSDRNEFRCQGSFEIFGSVLDGFDVKIDTGCPETSVPLRRTGLNAELIDQYMRSDYADANIIKCISFGVNDDMQKRNRDKELFRQGNYDMLNSVTCKRKLKGFKIDNCLLGDVIARISYTRVGNILIGMDILSKLDIHIAKINHHEEYFIACPLDAIKKGNADSYFLELENLFHLGSNIYSVVFS